MRTEERKMKRTETNEEDQEDELRRTETRTRPLGILPSILFFGSSVFFPLRTTKTVPETSLNLVGKTRGLINLRRTTKIEALSAVVQKCSARLHIKVGPLPTTKKPSSSLFFVLQFLH